MGRQFAVVDDPSRRVPGGCAHAHGAVRRLVIVAHDPAWELTLRLQWGVLVFTDEAGGPLAGFHVTRCFRKLLRMAGLPPMRYHDFRHGAASLMTVQGVPPRVAMELWPRPDQHHDEHLQPRSTRDATGSSRANGRKPMGESLKRVAVKSAANRPVRRRRETQERLRRHRAPVAQTDRASVS